MKTDCEQKRATHIFTIILFEKKQQHTMYVLMHKRHERRQPDIVFQSTHAYELMLTYTS